MPTRFILLILISVLYGCATVPQDRPDTSPQQQWQQRHSLLDTIDQWQIRGRVALFVNDEVHNLGLSWRREGTHSTIKLEAPFGQGVVKLTLQPGLAQLSGSDGYDQSHDNPDLLLEQATGWSIPVTGLSSWITGNHHALSTHSREIDHRGLILSLQQDHWTINFLSYEDFELPSTQTLLLPEKIYMKRDQLALKIVIDQWQSANAAPSDLFPDFPR